jgi:hypothetical protein
MAGSLTNTNVDKIRVGARDFYEITLDWKGNTASIGTVQFNIATTLANNHPKIFATATFGGFLTAVQSIPGASGDLATNLASAMNILIKDPYGLDVMAGVLVGTSTTAAEIHYADPPILLNSELSLNMASTGTHSAQGRLIFWIEK